MLQVCGAAYYAWWTLSEAVSDWVGRLTAARPVGRPPAPMAHCRTGWLLEESDTMGESPAGGEEGRVLCNPLNGAHPAPPNPLSQCGVKSAGDLTAIEQMPQSGNWAQDGISADSAGAVQA